MALGAILIGLIGRVYFPLMSGLPNADRENLYPVLAAEHLHPGWFDSSSKIMLLLVANGF
jgi:Na+/proline symporter